jgi:DnaJ-class molecular chaperone
VSARKPRPKPPPAQKVPAAGSRNPGDEARSGSRQAGEHICPACGGSGRQAGAPCPACGGTGKIVAIAGDA